MRRLEKQVKEGLLVMQVALVTGSAPVIGSRCSCHKMLLS